MHKIKGTEKSQSELKNTMELHCRSKSKIRKKTKSLWVFPGMSLRIATLYACRADKPLNQAKFNFRKYIYSFILNFVLIFLLG